MKIFLLLLSILISFTLSACSGEYSAEKREQKKSTLNGDHVWKAQTDTLKKAQEVSKLANDMAKEQRKAMEALKNNQ